MNYKRYVMRRVRRQCYRNYRRQSNLKKRKVVPTRRKVNNANTNGVGILVMWIFVIIIVGIILYAITN